MATTPAASSTPALGFTPAFKRVAQSNDFDCAFACIATIAGKTLEEVRATAVKQFHLREHGPYWVTEALITSLAAHYGWTATVWKEVLTPILGLPDLAILMVDYDEETELGRHVVFHRIRQASPKPAIEYVIDPAYWVAPDKQITADLKALAPSWYIGLHPMNTPTTYAKK